MQTPKPTRVAHPPVGKTLPLAFPTPSVEDVILGIRKDVNVPGYKAQPYGTAHPDAKAYPSHTLSLIKLSEDGQTAMWYYTSPLVNDDAWNFTKKYAEESRTNPVVIRTYTLPREDYKPAENGSADPVDDTLVLSHEEEIAVADRPEFAALFIKVVRVYERFPGSWIETTRVEADGVVSVKTRRNLVSEIKSSEDLTGDGLWTKTSKGKGDSFAADEIIEFRVIPSESVRDSRQDTDGATVSIEKTLESAAVIAEITDRDSISTGGTWTRIQSEAVSDKVARKIVETRVIPGPTFTVQIASPLDGAAVTETRQMVKAASFSAAPEVVADGLWTRTFSEKIEGSTKVVWKVIQTRAIPGETIATSAPNKDGDLTSETRQLVAAAGFGASSAISSGTWTRIFDETVAGSSKVVWKVTQVRTTQNPLPAYSAEIPDRAIPSKLRSGLPTRTTETTEKGTAAPVSLATGDFARSETQLDAYTFRRKIVNLALDSLPISVTDKSWTEKFGGGPTTITFTLSASAGTVDEGLLVLSSHIEILGNGLYLKTTEVRDGSEWPVLVGTEIGDLGIATQFTEQTVPAGTTGGVSGNTQTRVRPEDSSRSTKTVVTVPTTALDSIVIPMHGTTSVDIPPELISLEGVGESSFGQGTYSQTGNWQIGSAANNRGNGSLNLSGNAQGSAAAMMDVKRIVKHVWGNSIPCIFYLFFAPKSTTRSAIIAKLSDWAGGTVNPWPRFRPQIVTLICSGQKKALDVRLNVSAVESINTDYLGSVVLNGWVRTTGSGASYDVAVSQKIIQIPPTIHGPLSVSTPTLSQPTNAQAFISNGSNGIGIGPVAFQADAHITPTSVGATDGDFTVPSSGLYLHRLSPEPARANPDYLKYIAEVVNFADLQ